ncbi:MAG TPA: type III-B CRISPR module-associated protein Cmr5 [Myxococcota bacterium]|nr:type III-B CRISPR module-associated protein Cmr5 [Myxococcota bacterium]HQK51572.1 type III-B CRISPR module-associated protein Cmr5 [Myxococcota bacterium]
MRHSLDKALAEAVWTQILALERGEGQHQPLSEKGRKDFKNRCQDFPRCLRQNGLTLALTFFQGKSDSEKHQTYLDRLAAVLASESLRHRTGIQWAGASETVTTLIDRAVRSDVRAYRQMTGIVSRASLWFKRLAEARWSD